MCYNQISKGSDSMNNKGYSIKELIVLFAILAVVFGIGIIKSSYALEEASDESSFIEQQNKNILLASELYAQMNPDNFKETETFIYGSELLEHGLLINAETRDFNQIKIKITKNEDNSYQAEIVES